MTPRKGRPTGLRLLVALSAVALLASAPHPRAEAANAPGGRWVFRTYAEDEGLTNLSPTALLQDKAGFVWAGTQGGLFRFEGKSFRRFGVDEGLPNAQVLCLHETASGKLYVGTRGGLARWDGFGFVALGAKTGLPEVPVLGLASDPTLLYVGTSRGLFLSLGESFHVDARKDGPEVAVTALSVDATGALLFARGGTLYRREAGQAKDFGTSKALPALDRIDATLVDAEGRLFVRTPTRLLMLPKDGTAFVAADAGLPPISNGSLSLEPSGALLVPTQAGLGRRDASGLRLVTRRDGLEGDAVLSALMDREGSLWVGLSTLGLARRVGDGTFTVYNTASGLPHDAVWAIARERRPHGALWIGTQDGLARLDEDGSVRAVSEKDGLAGNTVVALAADREGAVWAGSYPGGVTYARPGAILRRYGAEGLAPSDFQVLSLHVRENGEVWAGATTGAYRLSTKTDRFERVTSAGAEEQDSVFAFAESGQELYAAGRLGLTRLTGTSPRRLGRRNGLKSDFLSSLTALPDGGFLVSYREAGAARVHVDGDRLLVSAFGDDAGFDRLLFLGRDTSDGIWAGGNGGVARYDKDGATPVRFDREDGLPGRDATQNAFLADEGGIVWFGTKRGLVRYQPGGQAPPDAPVGVAFTSASAGGKKLRVDRPIVLASDMRTLSVSWAGLSSRAAGRLRYRYSVAGLHGKPIETSRLETDLVGLDAGRYRIDVVALTPSGKVSATPATLEVTVSPLTWETWWFRTLVVLVLGIVIAALVRRRTGQLLAEREALRAEVEKRDDTIASLNRQVAEASITDPLTQTRNRRFFFETIGSDVERAIRAFSPHGTPAERRNGDIVSYLVHVDGLADINARHGNRAGDAVLVEVARRLKGVVRSSDFLVRWDGEEFFVVTRSSSREQGQVLAQRILSVITEASVTLPDGQSERPSCSVGWIPFPFLTENAAAFPYEEVLRLTALVLAEAQRTGSNRALGALAASTDPAALRQAFQTSLRSPALNLVSSEGPVR